MSLLGSLLIPSVVLSVGVVVLARVQAGECAASCDLACRVSSARASLLQFAMGKQNLTNRALGALSKTDQPGNKTVKTPNMKVIRELVKKAKANANKSGMPYEFMMDVDYLHDANNPLDNNMSLMSSFEKGRGRGQGNNDDVDDLGVAGASEGRNRSKPRLLDMSNCTTRADPRVTNTLFTSKVAQVGTRCKFGQDDRDEGAHCIDVETGKYGSHGWCWTIHKEEWGACNEHCPLGGAAGVLERRIAKLDGFATNLLAKVKNKTGGAKANVLQRLLKVSGQLKPQAEDKEVQAVSARLEEAENDEEYSPRLRMSALSLQSKVRQLSKYIAEAKPKSKKKSKKGKAEKADNEDAEEAEEAQEEEEGGDESAEADEEGGEEEEDDAKSKKASKSKKGKAADSEEEEDEEKAPKAKGKKGKKGKSADADAEDADEEEEEEEGSSKGKKGKEAKGKKSKKKSKKGKGSSDEEAEDEDEAPAKKGKKGKKADAEDEESDGEDEAPAKKGKKGKKADAEDEESDGEEEDANEEENAEEDEDSSSSLLEISKATKMLPEADAQRIDEMLISGTSEEDILNTYAVNLQPEVRSYLQALHGEVAKLVTKLVREKQGTKQTEKLGNYQFGAIEKDAHEVKIAANQGQDQVAQGNVEHIKNTLGHFREKAEEANSLVAQAEANLKQVMEANTKLKETQQQDLQKYVDAVNAAKKMSADEEEKATEARKMRAEEEERAQIARKMASEELEQAKAARKMSADEEQKATEARKRSAKEETKAHVARKLSAAEDAKAKAARELGDDEEKKARVAKRKASEEFEKAKAARNLATEEFQKAKLARKLASEEEEKATVARHLVSDEVEKARVARQLRVTEEERAQAARQARLKDNSDAKLLKATPDRTPEVSVETTPTKPTASDAQVDEKTAGGQISAEEQARLKEEAKRLHSMQEVDQDEAQSKTRPSSKQMQEAEGQHTQEMKSARSQEQSPGDLDLEPVKASKEEVNNRDTKTEASEKQAFGNSPSAPAAPLSYLAFDNRPPAPSA